MPIFKEKITGRFHFLQLFFYQGSQFLHNLRIFGCQIIFLRRIGINVKQ